jgi:transposase-like protein
LTIAEEELGDGYCPECFENSGSKRYDFEELGSGASDVARYRCEECGAVIKSRQ